MFPLRQSLFAVLLALTPLLATAFEVESIDKERVQLDSHTNKPVWTLVFLWSLECFACEAQKPNINVFANEYRGKGGQVVGLVLDGVEFRNQITDRLAVSSPDYPNYLVLADVFGRQFHEATNRNYIGLSPTFLLYQPGGELLGVHTGPIDLDQVRRIINTSTD